jgi:hypothetical protein
MKPTSKLDDPEFRARRAAAASAASARVRKDRATPDGAARHVAELIEAGRVGPAGIESLNAALRYHAGRTS